MTAVIHALYTEAQEIRNNISRAARDGEITWLQRDELMKLVETDVEMKIKLAVNLLRDWTGGEKGN